MDKRKVPIMLKKVLDLDIYLTDQCVKILSKITFFKSLKNHSKIFEISCHGLVWIPCWIGLIWILNNKNLYQMQVNFFLGLILDITLVAMLKAFFRRRRPSGNSSSFEIGPDKFSFPSGHASRALYVALYFSHSVYSIFVPSLWVWAITVCISRVLSRKHHLLDILVGGFLGVLEMFFISFTYLSEETCTNLIWWLTDEKLDGGEYHV